MKTKRKRQELALVAKNMGISMLRCCLFRLVKDAPSVNLGVTFYISLSRLPHSHFFI